MDDQTTGGAGRNVRRRWLGAMLCAAACAARPARAAPEDDYRSGLRSYQGGDVVSAMQELRRAADQGHAPAQGLLASILDRAGIADEAMRYYRMAAEQGDADAEVSLAQLHLGGAARDEGEALRLLTRAAARGHAIAIESIADAYLRQTLGLTAAKRDNNQAVAAIQRAAERDYLPALEGLAVAYRAGQFGLPVDAAEAARWQARADQLRQQRAVAGKSDTSRKR